MLQTLYFNVTHSYFNCKKIIMRILWVHKKQNVNVWHSIKSERGINGYHKPYDDSKTA